MKQRFSYCPKCAGKLTYILRGGIDRLTCLSCNYILYENPVAGVAGILMDEGKILLGRRSANSTYPGLWCIPCGYVEYTEDVRQALIREYLEETGLRVEPQSVFTVLSNFHNPEMHTVGIWFNVCSVGGILQPGDDLDLVEFYSFESIPPLAFPTDAIVIAMLQAAQKEGKRGITSE